MKNRLYHVVGSLSSKELDRFLIFVQSPFFNQHQDTVRLLKAISSLFPQGELEDKALFFQLYPEKKYESGRIRSLKSRLVKLLDKFLIQLELEKSESTKDSLLIQAYSERELFKAIERKLEFVEKRIEDRSQLQLETARLRFNLEETKLDIKLKQGERSDLFQDGKLMRSLDRYFLAKRFKILGAIENLSGYSENVVKPAAVFETISLAEKAMVSNEPIVEIYQLALMGQLQPSDASIFEKLISLVDQYHSAFQKNELFDIIGVLVSKNLSDLRKGVAGSLRRVFQNYQKMVELDIVFGMGKTSAHLVRNIISAAARLNEFEWSKRFLAVAEGRIATPYREQVFNFGTAQIAFHEKDYPLAKKHLLEVVFEDPMVKLSADNILLKCYFATQETEALYALSDALRRYLHRHNEFSDNYKKGYLNFLSLLKSLYDLRWKLDDKYRPMDIKMKMDGYEVFFNREWVNEQLIQMRYPKHACLVNLQCISAFQYGLLYLDQRRLQQSIRCAELLVGEIAQFEGDC